MGEDIKRILMVILGMILILSAISIIPLKEPILDCASAGSIWVQTTETDFNAGTLENVTVTPEGNVTLALQTKNIEEDFTDESNISYKINVIVDSVLGEARLVKGINKTFGGPDIDWGWWVQQTSDFGYALFSETGSFGAGDLDAWLIKTDEKGNEEINKTFGGPAKDGARSGQQTNDGGYILGGYADSFGFPGHDGWLIRTDSLGNELWNYTYGGPGTDAFYSVVQTTDGGFVATGYETSYGPPGYNVWLYRTDAVGSELWTRYYGEGGSEYGMSVKQTSDDGYIITGTTDSFGTGDTDLWLIKTDVIGIEQWNHTFGGLADDWGGSVFQTSDGGYIVSGDTRSYGSGGYDVWLIKTDEFGNEEWNMTYGEAFVDDTGYCVHQTFDGGYVIAASATNLFTGYTDIWLIKTDSNGNEQWRRIFGGAASDWGYSVDQTVDGGFILIGYTASYGAGSIDVWLIKTDTQGNISSEGELISANMLSGKNAFSIDTFNCTASIPPGTLVQVQFSQDKLDWYDSARVLDSWDTLTDGFNSIDLSLLGWGGSELFYKMYFFSNTVDIPSVENVNISYSVYSSSGVLTSQTFDCGETNVDWKTLSWIALEPPGTEVRFQLRAADTQANLSTMNFSGPDGSSATYYDFSPANTWSGLDGYPWVQFKAFLIGTSELTPILQEVTIYYDFIPDAPTNLTIEIWGNNLTLNWTAPQSSPSPVNHYLIYRVNDPNSFTYSDSEIIYNSSNNPGHELDTMWNDTQALLDQSNNYFYVVRAISDDGGNDTNENIVGKYVIQLSAGWNLISLPLTQKDTSISEVLRTIDGQFNVVQWYDAKNGIWRSTSTGLTDINRSMGLWIYMKNKHNLSVVGAVSESTDIALYKGWNLVGYPSFTIRNLNDALIGINWQAVQQYNAFDSNDPWKHNSVSKPDRFNDLKEMKPGYGYWVYAAIDDTWVTTRSYDDARSEIWRVYGLKEKDKGQHNFELIIEDPLEITNEEYLENNIPPGNSNDKKEIKRIDFSLLSFMLLVILVWIGGIMKLQSIGH
ncbi:MAG: fibronectin type III domain-containing protein [Thermoplasmata archaeon]|nr:MAG: fibronectin type III domain-containing protein [Thermoplasmata archaeon]